MWLLPELPFLTMRICVVICSSDVKVSVWLITPTFFPWFDWSMASESTTTANVSASRVPKPSSMKRLSQELVRYDSDDKPKAKPKLTMKVSPPESEVVSRTSSARSWSMTRRPKEFFTWTSS